MTPFFDQGMASVRLLQEDWSVNRRSLQEEQEDQETVEACRAVLQHVWSDDRGAGLTAAVERVYDLFARWFDKGAPCAHPMAFGGRTETYRMVAVMTLEFIVSMLTLTRCARICGAADIESAIQDRIGPLIELVRSRQARIVPWNGDLERFFVSIHPDTSRELSNIHTLRHLAPMTLSARLPALHEPVFQAALRADPVLARALYDDDPTGRTSRDEMAYLYRFLPLAGEAPPVRKAASAASLGWTGPIPHEVAIDLGAPGLRLHVALIPDRAPACRVWDGSGQLGDLPNVFLGQTQLTLQPSRLAGFSHKGGWLNAEPEDDEALAIELRTHRYAWSPEVRALTRMAAVSSLRAGDLAVRLRSVSRRWSDNNAEGRYAVIRFLHSLIRRLPDDGSSTRLLRGAEMARCRDWDADDWTQTPLEAFKLCLKTALNGKSEC